MEDALKTYVETGVGKEELGKTTAEWTTSPTKVTLWRGQGTSVFDPTRTSFSSMSRNKEVAISHASSRCCVFEIVVFPGVRMLDVNAYFPKNPFRHEEEVLVEGGGTLTLVKESVEPFPEEEEYEGEVPIPNTVKSKGLRVLHYEYHPKKGGRRWTMPRKMTRRYCKTTPCRKMGFTQRASCRPWKNCSRQHRSGRYTHH
jgi:hypothetical protein